MVPSDMARVGNILFSAQLSRAKKYTVIINEVVTSPRRAPIDVICDEVLRKTMAAAIMARRAIGMALAAPLTWIEIFPGGTWSQTKARNSNAIGTKAQKAPRHKPSSAK